MRCKLKYAGTLSKRGEEKSAYGGPKFMAEPSYSSANLLFR